MKWFFVAIWSLHFFSKLSFRILSVQRLFCLSLEGIGLIFVWDWWLFIQLKVLSLIVWRMVQFFWFFWHQAVDFTCFCLTRLEYDFVFSFLQCWSIRVLKVLLNFCHSDWDLLDLVYWGCHLPELTCIFFWFHWYPWEFSKERMNWEVNVDYNLNEQR